MESGSDRTFETYELLENIIASIESQRSIFIIQRVCKAWRTIIGRSVTIQKILCAAPLQGAVAPREPKKPVAFGRRTDIVYAQNLTLSSFVPQRRRPRGLPADEDGHLDIELWFLYKPEQHEPAASYRRLYLTQPPCTTVEVGAVRSGSARWQDYVDMIVHDQNGVKLGLLEDLVHNIATCGNAEEANDVEYCVRLNAPQTAADTEAVRRNGNIVDQEDKRSIGGDASNFLRGDRWVWCEALARCNTSESKDEVIRAN